MVSWVWQILLSEKILPLVKYYILKLNWNPSCLVVSHNNFYYMTYQQPRLNLDILVFFNIYVCNIKFSNQSYADINFTFGLKKKNCSWIYSIAVINRYVWGRKWVGGKITCREICLVSLAIAGWVSFWTGMNRKAVVNYWSLMISIKVGQTLPD